MLANQREAGSVQGHLAKALAFGKAVMFET